MEGLRKFLDSFSLTSGAALVAVLSAGVFRLVSSVGPAVLRKIWVLIVPFILAYCLYWSPVWLGNDSSEYGPGAFLCFGRGFVAGVIACTITSWFLKSGSSPTG